ncbi:acyl-CoA dehydrogenase family protein [Bordetella bronchiseptica]|uniref:acyl-CoA dehydrogenase family protein n=1 Tax=Bordetella bronchiseptica TaxID=518 RepID=UPI000460C4A9|nr:acyl-CoA dehydrogenase family protein [Bordetella bronchiseptica]KDC66990.1 putative acyl-CoA dehydrogenase [Bordetella bronchiseptica MBORD591]KDD11106.1 putative acyl-CoA dehydrogenase [Bordetella bronchiseptica MBORD707]
MSLSFAFSSEHEAVRDTVRRLCQEELAPLVFEAEEQEAFPRRVFERWGELGLLGVRYPEADGGSGLDKVSDCIVREELSYLSQAFASTWSAHTHLGIWPIWKAGTPAQKARFLAPALAGRKVAGFGLSEPDGGSNVRAMKTRAERVEGGWRLHGSKLYITNAPFADFLLVAARTSAALKPESISLFIVELPNAGFDIAKLKKEGIRASETALIHIDNAFVPDDCLLGETEGTYPLILESLSENRVGVAANALGMARAAFDAAASFANDRLVAGKRVGEYQAIAHKLADMSAQIEATRWLVYYGAWRVDQGTLDAATAARVKLVASETAVAVSEQAIRIFGGAGIMREYPVGRIHRDALVYVIGEGTSEIQKNIIARSLGFKP